MTEKGFLGTGLKFPVQVNKGTGRFMMASGEQSVKEALYLILMTAKGERFMSPEFGSSMMTYTFMDTSSTMTNVMANDLRTLILRQEPRISDVDVRIEEQTGRGRLVVSIDYEIRTTNVKENLVFPFYLQAVEEIRDE